jgi:hypothetical protein
MGKRKLCDYAETTRYWHGRKLISHFSQNSFEVHHRSKRKSLNYKTSGRNTGVYLCTYGLGKDFFGYKCFTKVDM